nr:MAG TPA: hypothetical protein [Caudoviricetes sp.]
MTYDRRNCHIWYIIYSPAQETVRVFRERLLPYLHRTHKPWLIWETAR